MIMDDFIWSWICDLTVLSAFIRINLPFLDGMVGLGGIWENAQKAINYMLWPLGRLISLEDTPLTKGKKENADADHFDDDGVGNEIRKED